MPFVPCRLAVLLAGLLWAGRAHASGGSLGAPPPPPPPLGESSTGFDGLRKPPIPVSFLSHEAGWIEFQYPPSARERVAPLIAHADDLRGELAETLGQTPLDGIEVRVARGPDEMATLAPAGVAVRAQTSGAAYPALKLIVLSLGNSAPLGASELAGAFRRELARTALDEAVGNVPLPAWWVEGFVGAFSGESDWLARAGLYAAAVRRRLLPLTGLHLEADGHPDADLSLAQAADFMGFLAEPEQHSKLAATVTALHAGQTYRDALLTGYGVPFERLEQAWRDELQRRATTSAFAVGVGGPGVLALAWFAARAWRRRARTRSSALRAKANDGRRVHIVFSRRDERAEPLPPLPEAEIPKVEHEGEWHTLH